MTFDREEVGRKRFWSKRSRSEERKVSFFKKCETNIVWSIRSFCPEEKSKKSLLTGRNWEKRVLVKKVQV